MPLPKKIKKYLPLTESKIGLARREELVDKINKDGTYLPKSLLHADLDGGFLDFVKNELKTIVDGKVIPTIDILVTTQNWAQFTETWEIQNIDRNVELPFISVVRIPEVKYGTNPSLLYTIPNRRQYYYAQVPTWDGNRMGVDVYKIPQPVPIDITYQVKIVCNRMRELNQFNKNVIEKFSSRQSYQVIKGHYIPIVMGNISDESVMDGEKRKYYIQSYEFTMLGFLIDENEFIVSPAISRYLQVTEVDTQTTKRGKRKIDKLPDNFNAIFVVGNNILNQTFDYTTNLKIASTENVEEYSVYINNDFYGVDVSEIQINIGDLLRLEIVKTNTLTNASIIIDSPLLY
jgi:hypothetical protein